MRTLLSRAVCYLKLHLFVGQVGAVGACGGPAPTDASAGAKLVPSQRAQLRRERGCFWLRDVMGALWRLPSKSPRNPYSPACSCPAGCHLGLSGRGDRILPSPLCQTINTFVCLLRAETGHTSLAPLLRRGPGGSLQPLGTRGRCPGVRGLLTREGCGPRGGGLVGKLGPSGAGTVCFAGPAGRFSAPTRLPAGQA